MRRCLGEEVFAAFAADDVTDIYINPHEERVRFDTRSRGELLTDYRMTSGAVEQFLSAAATLVGAEFSRSECKLEIELPEQDFFGARLSGFGPPMALGYSFVIAKLPTEIYPLDSYETDGIMTTDEVAVIKRAVTEHWNIIVGGGMRAGKSALTNAILKEVANQFPQERIIILEDTRELLPSSPDHLRLKVVEGHELKDLVKYSYRGKAKRIFVGEVRDETARQMLGVWDSGHPGGVCTVHVETAERGLRKIARMAQHADRAPPHQLVGDVIDLVVVMRGSNERRWVEEIARVHGYENGKFEFEPAA